MLASDLTQEIDSVSVYTRLIWKNLENEQIKIVESPWVFELFAKGASSKRCCEGKRDHFLLPVSRCFRASRLSLYFR